MKIFVTQRTQNLSYSKSRTKKKTKRKVWKPNDSPARWKQIFQKYGLTKDAYLHILDEQGGVCYICHKDPKDIRPRRHLSVDHDHRTGRIRGLLCFNCNHKILGWYIRDDAEKARRILEYLTRETNYGKVPS